MPSYKVFILDVDGVMTDGKFYYSKQGKVMKVFGADDNDALSMLNEYIDIIFITGDKKGYSISKKRIDDMGFKLNLVSTIKRIDWIKNKYNLSEVIYMGDGIFDHYVMQKVGYSISTANSDANAKKYSNYITKRNGAERAVAEACIHIMEKFFEPFNPDELPSSGNFSGEWQI